MAPLASLPVLPTLIQLLIYFTSHVETKLFAVWLLQLTLVKNEDALEWVTYLLIDVPQVFLNPEELPGRLIE